MSKKGVSQYLNTSGSWYPNVASNVIAEAGLNYNTTYKIQSQTNQTMLNLSLGGGIFNTLFNGWQVDVSRSDIHWNSNLKLEVKRTSNGTGSIFSSISGGTIDQQVLTSNSSFFNGVGNFSNISVQYQISGFSVLIPVDTYSTTVIFTLIDN
ncbi:hypothetical protein EGI22_08155 [Lacihabitans sp. LS3-19]|nr:hypothetical protein [Lacihabitans sp. LS3-19]